MHFFVKFAYLMHQLLSWIFKLFWLSKWFTLTRIKIEGYFNHLTALRIFFLHYYSEFGLFHFFCDLLHFFWVFSFYCSALPWTINYCLQFTFSVLILYFFAHFGYICDYSGLSDHCNFPSNFSLFWHIFAYCSLAFKFN